MVKRLLVSLLLICAPPLLYGSPDPGFDNLAFVEIAAVVVEAPIVPEIDSGFPVHKNVLPVYKNVLPGHKTRNLKIEMIVYSRGHSPSSTASYFGSRLTANEAPFYSLG